VQHIHGGDRKIFEVMTSTLSKGTLGSLASLLAATLYRGNPDKNHKLWNIVSSERNTPYAGAAGMLLHINGKFLTAPHCQFRGAGQGMKQTYLYLWYPLFQAQWDRYDQRNHQT
jgi:hypothetical protein